jgi:hypothetical protein
MSSKEALVKCKNIATENLAKLISNKPMQGNLFALDPETYCGHLPTF